MSSDPLSLSELDDNNEDELQASDANAGALMDPKSMVHSGMFLSLIHQICSAYEKDPSKSEKMFRLICQQMNTLKLLPPRAIIDTFRPMQAAYTNVFRKMMHAALENLQDRTDMHRMLSLPATEQERTAVFLQMQSPLLRLPKITPEDIINSHTTRYHTDFEESCILGKGGFGKVYKVYSKIDQRYYAIKKIKLKQNNIEKSYKLVKEVQLLASLKHPNIVGYNTSWIEAEPMNTDNTYQGLNSRREPVTSLKCLPPSSSESPRSSSEQESSTTDKNNVKIEDLGNKGEQSPGLWINDANISPLNQYVLHPNADNLASSPSRLSRSPSDSTSTLVNSPITPTSTVCCPDGTPRDGFCNGDVQSTDFRMRNKESSFSQELSTSESSFDMWSSKTTMSVEKTMKVDSQILEDSDFQKSSSRSVSSTEHHSESRRTEVHSYTHEQDSESDIIFHNHDYVNLDSTEEYSDICFSFENSQNDQINLLDEVRGSHTSISEESSNSVDNVLKSSSATCNNFTEDKTTNALQLQKDRLHVRGVFGTTLPRRLQQNVCGKITSKMKIVNLDDSTTEVRAPRQNRRRHRSKSQDGIKSTPKPETRMLSLQDFPVFRVVLCIQMQLCSHTLSDWLRQRNIKTDQVEHSLDVVNMYENMHIFKQMLDGIEYIHSQSLIHRDLKPKNIFLEGASTNLQVLIGDFGLAKEDVSHDLTPDYQNAPHARASAPKKHTAEVGTTIYASPEQLEGTMYDCKSDIYSSGIILFEMFHPFSTQMERAIVIGRVREGCIPCEIDQKWPDQYKTIGQMTHNNSCQRPHATDVLKGPLFLSKDEVIKDLHAKLSEKDAELSEKDAELSEKDAKLSEKDVKLSEKDVKLSEKDVKLSEKDAKLSEKDVELSEKDAELSEKDAKLSEKDAEIQRLRQIIAKLEMSTS